MLSKLFKALAHVQTWFGSSLVSMLVAAFKQLEIQMRTQDIDRVLRIVRIIERVANTAIDICLKTRAILSDGKLDGQEIEQLSQLIRNRIAELEGDKKMLSEVE
jgi:hypothetical protein